MYSYQNLATNEYPNIFVSNKLTRTNIRIYSFPRNDTNEYPNKYLDQKYSNNHIFKYIRHTLLRTVICKFLLVICWFLMVVCLFLTFICRFLTVIFQFLPVIWRFSSEGVSIELPVQLKNKSTSSLW